MNVISTTSQITIHFVVGMSFKVFILIARIVCNLKTYLHCQKKKNCIKCIVSLVTTFDKTLLKGEKLAM